MEENNIKANITTNQPNYWAVLIGINFYTNAEDCLEGCVRDVDNIKWYLLEPGSSAPAPTVVHLETFTASTPPLDPNAPPPCRPTEAPEFWPTFTNVTASLQRVTASARSGDYVYIHYSGHGVSKRDASSSSNRSTGDLALALFDEACGSRYLRGLELAALIGDMVKKGLLVTLVLDCCFSGSVVRHGESTRDSAVRTRKYDPAIDAAYPQDYAIGGSQLAIASLRDAQMVPKWLVEPNGYTILTACGPYENASELRVSNSERNGALSYFLYRALIALRASGVEVTHQSLYQYVCIRFHADYPQQNPMRFGNNEMTFFGNLRSGLDLSFVSVFTTKPDDRLWLSAGHAHGVSKDDEYAVYPHDTPEDAQNLKKEDPLIVKVGVVRGLTSELVYLDQRSSRRAKTGCKARPLTHLSPEKIRTRLIHKLGNKAQWRAASKQRRFLRLISDDEDEDEEELCLFWITCNEQNEYEIRNQSDQSIISLPKVPANKQKGLESILDILDHACAFKYIEKIENRVPSKVFEDSFFIQLGDPTKEIFTEAGVLDVTHNGKLQLRVQNHGDKALYVHIYNLGPEWQVRNLTSLDGGGDYVVVPPHSDPGKGIYEIKMEVPECFRSKDLLHCEDVIKIFVTRRPSSFTSLVLPKIHESAQHRNSPNLLSDFLSGLAKSTRGAANDIPDEEWAARNFVIRTHC